MRPSDSPGSTARTLPQVRSPRRRHASIPVPERVHAALVKSTGPFKPYLDVLQAVEQESVMDIRSSADQLMLSVFEVNLALLRALAAARQLN